MGYPEDLVQGILGQIMQPINAVGALGNAGLQGLQSLKQMMVGGGQPQPQPQPPPLNQPLPTWGGIDPATGQPIINQPGVRR